MEELPGLLLAEPILASHEEQRAEPGNLRHLLIVIVQRLRALIVL